MTEYKHNYEWRSIPEVPHIEVTRDGDVRYKKGEEKYDNRGNRIDPEMRLRDTEGVHRSVQAIITKAFPDIPMRYPYAW